MALVGLAHPDNSGFPGLVLRAFRDDVAPEGGIGLRAINAASLLPSMAFGTGRLGAGFSTLFADVPFGGTGSAGDAGAPDASRSVDPNGYESLGALAGATLSAHGHGATVDAVVVTNVTAAAGGLLTFVLIDGAQRPSASAARMIQCVDNAGTLGLVSACAVLPE